MINIDDKIEILDIWDTAGIQARSSSSSRQYKKTKLFVLVYSISNLRSLEYIKPEYIKIFRYHLDDQGEGEFNAILVGNIMFYIYG